MKKKFFVSVSYFYGYLNGIIVKVTNTTTWKLSSITPLPKKPNPQSNNDYRPIALTSVIMKCFERIMKARILKHVKLEENQFAYRCKRSTKDACISLDHFVRSHLEKPNSYARIL